MKEVPDKENIAGVEKQFPDSIVQVIATKGKKLSDQLQDSNSFRYGLINMGADSQEELSAKFRESVEYA